MPSMREIHHMNTDISCLGSLSVSANVGTFGNWLLSTSIRSTSYIQMVSIPRIHTNYNGNFSRIHTAIIMARYWIGLRYCYLTQWWLWEIMSQVKEHFWARPNNLLCCLNMVSNKWSWLWTMKIQGISGCWRSMKLQSTVNIWIQFWWQKRIMLTRQGFFQGCWIISFCNV